MPTYKGKEILSKEETIKAWKEVHINKKTVVAVSLRMNVSESTIYRSFRRWGLQRDKK